MKNTNLVEIPLTSISPHPQNPRKDLGDLTELAESIRTTGILQNLTVVQNEDYTYTVIIGHRRLAAAKLAGLKTAPCAVVEMSEDDQLATMLTENMQRSDLTVYEQAEGIQLLLDRSFSIADIAEKTGFSESTIRRRTKLLELDKEAFKRSQQRQVSLADYEKLNEITDIDARNKLLDVLGTNNFNIEFVRAKETQKRREKKAELIEYLESLPNVKLLKKRHASIWKWVNFLYSKQDAEKLIKSNKEYCYENELSVGLYVKRTEAELERDHREEERREVKQKFISEARVINENTQHIRNLFVSDPPKLTKEQYQILVKEYIRTITEDDWRLPKCLGDSISNFDAVFEKDGGVSIMLEKISSVKDKTYSEKGRYVSNDIDNPRVISENLNSFYFLLNRLGYEMSDEEKQLRDGTHPIFTKYKGE
jgi:ParB family chromosome partitioning protein